MRYDRVRRNLDRHPDRRPLHPVCEEPHYRNLASSIPIWMPLATILPCGRPAADLR